MHQFIKNIVRNILTKSFFFPKIISLSPFLYENEKLCLLIISIYSKIIFEKSFGRASSLAILESDTLNLNLLYGIMRMYTLSYVIFFNLFIIVLMINCRLPPGLKQ